MEKQKTAAEKAEEKRIQRANMVLAKLDKIVEGMIDQIVLQKDEEDSARGTSTIVDGAATNNFIRKINALHIDGDENILIAIQERYDKAIDALKAAMREEDDSYKAQFKNELDKIMNNKYIRYDTIATTYKELVGRLERGEVQRDYYQEKADKKQEEIDSKEDFYKDRIGNADKILIILEPEAQKIKEKETVKKYYDRLVKLNGEIDVTKRALADPALDDDDKSYYEENLKRFTKERKLLVEEFSTRATDKDGKKYEKPEGKSDEDYIKDIDPNRVQEALDHAVQSFNNKINGMDSAKRTIIPLDKDFNEETPLDIANIGLVTNYKGANDIIDYINVQKKLWRTKMERDGFDKAKLNKEKQKLQERADIYDGIARGYNDEGATRIEDTGYDKYKYPIKQKFDWRHPFRSIRTYLERRRNENQEQKTMKSEFNIRKTKKQALKDIENLDKQGQLQKIDLSDKKRNKDKFLNDLQRNVSVSEIAVDKFWNKEKSRNESDRGR